MNISNKQSILRIVIVSVLIIVVVVISILTENNKKGEEVIVNYDTTYLFNGEDFTNSTIVLKDSTATPDSTFSLTDGKIFTTGDPFGYVRTKARYADYQLFVEWRWVEEPGNSGVFIHIQEDGIWPLCLECQLLNQKAGDFVCFPGFEINEHVDKNNLAIAKMEESSEREPGEWNQYDIRVKGDSVSIYVNDVLQNIATGTNYTEGYIALQSEGAPVEFRNVFLVQEKN